jgi:membrane protein
MLIIGATSVFAELQTSLDRIWRAPALKRETGLWSLLRARLLSFGMVVAIGFLLLVSLVFSAALSAVDTWGGTLFPTWHTLLQFMSTVVGFLITATLFAAAYRILPRVRIAWRDVAVGAIATAAMFELGKYLIGLYIGRASVASGFGAAGSFVIVLAWVYYSSQLFLFGAEFTWVYAHSHGSKAGQSPRRRRRFPSRRRRNRTPRESSAIPSTADRQVCGYCRLRFARMICVRLRL